MVGQNGKELTWENQVEITVGVKAALNATVLNGIMYSSVRGIYKVPGSDSAKPWEQITKERQ